MVNVGVIGLGPQWECGYRAALERLRSRIAVRAVYNAVESRAAQAAAAWNSEPADGICALLERPDVRAVLLLDTAWQGTRPFDFVLRCRKPALLSAWPQLAPAQIEHVARRARDESLTLIPAFPQRYMPATARLRELIATRIGRPQRIRIRTGCPVATIQSARPERIACESLLHVFDWCRQVIRTAPATVRASGESGGEALACVRRIEIAFRAPRGGSPCQVEIEVAAQEPAGPAGESAPADSRGPLDITIEAERGTAALQDSCTIRWNAAGDAGHAEESLASERSEFEVMLDLFCRRVVGGLIPVADFGDVARGLAIWAACEESWRTGEAVPVRDTRT
jgi:predicted dehydrogenase